MPELANFAKVLGNFYSLPPFGVGILTLALGVIVLIREKRSTTSLTFLGLTFCGAVWLLCYSLIYSASSEAAAMVWIKVENAAVTLIPGFTLLFSLSAAGRLQRLGTLALGVCFLSGIFFSSVFFKGGLIIGTFQYPWGYYAHYGPWGTLFLFFFFAVMVMSLKFFAGEYRRAQTPLQKSVFKFCFSEWESGIWDPWTTFRPMAFPFILLVLCRFSLFW